MKSAMIRWLICVIGLGALAQAQVQTPQLGAVRCADGAIRPVYGVPSAFVFGKPALQQAEAASFSDGGGLVSAKGRIQLFSSKGSLVSEFESNEAAPLVNIEGSPTTAVAWLPVSQSILRWDGTLFLRTNVPDQIHGKVTSIRVEGDNARLIVFDDKTASDLTVSLSSGDIVSASPLPGIETPAFQQESFVLFHDAEGLEVEGANGVRRTVSLNATDLVIERMAPNWLHLMSASSGRHWALHITEKTLDFSELPSPSATATAGAMAAGGAMEGGK